VPFGAHPTACHGKYSYDSDHLREYAALARTDDGFEKYRKTYIDALDHPAYLETIGVRRLIDLDARRRQSNTEEN
jgi:glutaconate CoA-transferase subunit A